MADPPPVVASADPRTTPTAVGALAALAVGTFCYITTESLPVGLLPLMATDLGVSLSAIGLLVTGYAATVVLTSVPLTLLTRRIPRRFLLSALLSAFVLATWVSAAASSYGVLLAGRVLTALTQAVFWSVVGATAAGLFSQRVRGRVLAVVFGSSALGIVLGVPGGTWLGQQAGWRVAFLALSGLCLLALVMTAVLMPTARPEQGHAASGTTPDARRYSLLVVTTALLVTGVFTAYTYISPFLTEVSGFPSRAVSPLLLVFGVAGIVGTIAAGALIDRSPRAAMISAVALQATALLGLYLVGTVAPVVIGLVALSGLSMSALAATLQSRILDVAPGSSDVASAGVGTAFNVGIGGGAFVGGLLLPGFGVRSTPLVGGLLAVAALGVVLAEPLVASSGGRRAHARPPTR